MTDSKKPLSNVTQDAPSRSIEVQRVTLDGTVAKSDVVAAEEPLEIRIVYGGPSQRRSKSLAITMRTPGHDQELALGFLQSEGIIQDASDVTAMEFAGPAPQNIRDQSWAHGNTLMVELAPAIAFQPELLQRNFYLTSSCGVCGKASLEALHHQGFKPLPVKPLPDREIVFSLPDRLRQQQEVFESTGGLHAAGTFDRAGNLKLSREDVGRHNALDKLVGARMQSESGAFPAPGQILVVSGRASFELVQKAIAARFQTLIAVGAPSSLAVELAREFNLGLIGFASSQRFNIYSPVAASR